MDCPFRNDFPVLSDPQHPLYYLDNAATTQKPRQVIDAVSHYYEAENANPLRGLYELSVKATERYQEARHKVALFLNAKEDAEIIYTRNSTESLNLLAYSWGLEHVSPGDKILITVMEHHSNLIPWQRTARACGAELEYLYPDREGKISAEKVAEKITPRTKIVAVTQVSNVLGCGAPLDVIIPLAHAVGAVVIVDGAQGAPHMPVDLQKLDCDFYVCSGHKMLAPMGIGVLYGKRILLDEMPPFMTGGEMIDSVSEQQAVFAPLPMKFEAGTPNVGGAVGLGAAVDYINAVGFDFIRAQEGRLMKYAMERMQALPYVQIFGPKDWQDHAGVLSFNIEGVHPHDVSSVFDTMGVDIRAGHHCAQPLMNYLGISSCCRASFYFYNTEDDIDHLIDAIVAVRKMFGNGTQQNL